MTNLPTVRVAHPSGEGSMVINQADYDAETHELVGEADSEPPTEPADDLDDLNVPDLREIASELEITNYSSLRKPDLIAAIREAREEA